MRKADTYVALEVWCDIGNVLCHMDIDPFVKIANEVIRNIYVIGNNILPILKQCQANHDLGLIKLKEHIAVNFCKLSEKELDHIISSWNKVLIPNNLTISFMENLVKKDALVKLTSNIGYEHKSIIDSILGPSLSKCVKEFSCDIGARKPSKLYYDYLMRSFEKQKNIDIDYSRRLIVYIDDLQENLDAATKMYNVIPFKLDISELSEKDLKLKLLELENLIEDSLRNLR